METVADTVISTVVVRSMGPDYTTTEAGDMTKVKSGAGVLAGSRVVTQLHPPQRWSEAAMRQTVPLQWR